MHRGKVRGDRPPNPPIGAGLRPGATGVTTAAARIRCFAAPVGRQACHAHGMSDAPTDPSDAPLLDQATRDAWTSTVVLGDGTSALIRPIEPSDAPALAAFHERQSAENRYRRYFSPKPTLNDRELEHFTNVDFVDRAALVAEQHGEFVGWASYERWHNRPDLEVAFQVDDHYQGRGIATLLLEHLAVIARHNGFSSFIASTMADNRGMLAVFAKAGWPIHRRFDSGMVDVDFSLDETAEYLDSVERREHRADVRAVGHLLLPSSIAVIGASDRPGSTGHTLWRHVATNERMPVYPVNHRHDTVGGVPAFARVTDIPDEVGVAVIAVPTDELEATIDDCIDKRVRGAVVVTVVDEGTIDLVALVAKARRNGLRIIGPASMGLASPQPGVSVQASLVAVNLPPGRVAISMQSGTLGSSLLRQAAELDLGISWFVSLGDKLDVSANDLLQFWEDDDATRVVAIYTESLGNPRKFARIARRVSRSRPIVSVRTGAALLDPQNAALYRQTGMIEVPTVTALLDTARVFATQPRMAGDRVAVISNSRSPAVLANASLTTGGLEPVTPPVALSWRSAPDDYEAAVRAALDDTNVDAVLVIHAPPSVGGVNAPGDAIVRAADGADKPIVAVMLGAGDGPLRRGSGIPSFAVPEQAVAALARMAAYARWLASESDVDDEVPSGIDRARAAEVLDAMAADGDAPPERLRELLTSYGIPMAPTRLVRPDDALEAAREIGYPVAIKAVQRRVGRSLEAGIALDLGNDDDVREAVASMSHHLGGDASELLVQSMVPPGTDLRLQVDDDPRLGPIVNVGLGGHQADVIGDTVSRLAPVSRTTGRHMVEQTRASAALSDDALGAVGDVVARLAHLASDHSRIDRIDINPMIVSPDGCQVVDATIVLGDAERPEPVRRLDS